MSVSYHCASQFHYAYWLDLTYIKTPTSFTALDGPLKRFWRCVTGLHSTSNSLYHVQNTRITQPHK